MQQARIAAARNLGIALPGMADESGATEIPLQEP
jgi:hypothetical protein